MAGPCRPGGRSLLIWLLMAGVLQAGADEKLCPCVSLKHDTDWPLLTGNLCCVNVSLPVDTLNWSVFSRLTGLRVLDLSGSGIVRITDEERGKNGTSVELLYLDNNELEELPDGFLSNAPNLKILHLENNKLKELPAGFLQVSDQIQEIYLNFNSLNSLPVSLLKSSLTKLNFLNNSLECTCALLDQLEPALRDNTTRALLEDIPCASPKDISGLLIGEVTRGRVCRSHSLTIALVCIPLAVVFLLGCWYVCCRTRKVKYSNTRWECNLVTVDRNGAGEHHHYEPQRSLQKDRRDPVTSQFRDPILLKPSNALLGSSRDLYEEVEIKLGTSEDSLMKREGPQSQEGPGLALALEAEEEELKDDQLEVETVSVTEVMKDSADREKLYLSQATDYYSLVPGLELEDSDHCEYETVEL